VRRGHLQSKSCQVNSAMKLDSHQSILHSHNWLWWYTIHLSPPSHHNFSHQPISPMGVFVLIWPHPQLFPWSIFYFIKQGIYYVLYYSALGDYYYNKKINTWCIQWHLYFLMIALTAFPNNDHPWNMNLPSDHGWILLYLCIQNWIIDILKEQEWCQI
jgi:hypothetical protein